MYMNSKGGVFLSSLELACSPNLNFQSLRLSEILGYISVLKSKTDIRNMILDQHSYSKSLCERRPGMYQNSADADRFGR